MSIFAYQVTNFAYQGDGLFAYQGLVDSQVQPNNGTFNLRPRKALIGRKRKKVVIVPEEVYVAPIEVIPLGPIEALAKELAVRGFPLSEVGLETEEEEEDALLAATIRLLQ